MESISPQARVPAGTNWPGLIWTLVRTDFKARYYGSFSGFLWALMKPLVMFVALISVFAFVFHSDRLYRDHLLIGLFLWDFFAEGTKTGLGALHAKGFLLTKAKFPSWILVVTSISNALITVTVFGVAMTVYLAITGRAPSGEAAVLFVFYLVSAALIIVGLSLASSVLFLRYRDLNQLWDVAIQAGFFVAPIIWPIGTVPEKYHFLLYLFPPTPIIEFSRSVLVDGNVPSMTAHLYLATETIAVMALGLLLYRALAPRAAEYL